ncbi:hypothetical protein NEOLEDRAFT_701518 [Neolentinus lepideus HHB14362 ss-1]|uniref:Vps53 N-terminal domain-containing protein n=1 Tax=Neolentinus lepideus HHB14362 ss-1 TaxID=1314782 RepID=A0A165V477_9AGAM|nr:hypothetical protein NEOLEDRAFT_701518 [Neolentinus lepideus HHB14362 ss-1]
MGRKSRAKKNLIVNVTTLKRLQVLVNALNQFEERAVEKRIQAVKQIAATFKSDTSIQCISQLWKRIHEVQGDPSTKIENDFEAYQLHTATSLSPPHSTPPV